MRIPELAQATTVRHSGRVVAGAIPPSVRVDAGEPPAAAAVADDAQLRVWMAGYQAGRLDGFEGLYAAVASPLRRYLVMLTRDAAIADDLLQESFLQVHRFRHTYDADQPLRPWLFAIARHVFLMHARATRRRLARVGPLPDDVVVPVPPEVEGLPDRIRVRAALDRIGPERREALLLHHVWGFSFREVGAVLGITEAAAKLRSSRGMADLRDVLGGNGPETVNG
jgi:RNA polymerase sigma-70 factor (ECF subfamily)